MVGLLIGLLLMIQPPDTVNKEIPVLHDSLKTSEGSHINLTSFKNWKYKSGDDTTWAAPDYDDSDWLTISSPSKISDSLFHGIGWLRLTLKVDSTYSKKQRYIYYESLGASELYVDGGKIHQVGLPSDNPEQEVLKNPNSLSKYLHPIAIKPGEQIVIALRYSLHDYSFFNTLTIGDSIEPIQLTLLIADIAHQKNSIQQSQLSLIAYIISSIILFAVMVLHLIMHFRFKEKGNIWIFLISFLLFITTSTWALDVTGIIKSQKIIFLRNITGLVQVFLPISLIPICLGKLLEVEFNKKWFYLILFPAVPLLLDFFFKGDIPLAVTVSTHSILFIIVAIGAFQIIREAQNKNKKHLWLITGSLFSYPVILLLAILLFVVFSIESNLLSWLLLILLFTMLPIGFSIYQIMRFFNAHGNLQKEINRQTAELEEAYEDLQRSHKELKTTKDQLVQQEKLASLGQLTAGIAHEIKNPLNFVNNFSDLSVELVEEARDELKTANGKGKTIGEALDILDSVEVNLKKINEHGSRADGIVKSMLQHSRGGDGDMEPTNLNELVKEYVNLAFHGMRAGENPINVDIELDLDEEVGQVPLIAEDFSRVIINLCNNAFDAMRKKVQQRQGFVDRANKKEETPEAYQPQLTVRSYQNNGNVIIEIEDNGPGIPEKVKDKILQPFFTTKEGTEGTGLGLSISNDILKVHGGSIDIKSKEGAGTKFLLKLKGGHP